MGGYGTVIYLVAMLALIYFVLIRPQNKQRKEQAQLLSSLKKGDKVVTIGGLHGSIVDLSEQRVTLKISDTTRVVFERSAIKSKISETGEAVHDSEKKDKEERFLEGSEEDKKIQEEQKN
jgi:preprotein translocase subunit YajC